MNKILIDTNIVIDLLARRKPFYEDAARLFSLADKKKITLSVSALTFANANYVLLKEKKQEEARAILRKFKLIVNVLSLNDRIIHLALNDNEFDDYEDAIQYFLAIENNQFAIITRNLKDFAKSKIPAMTAKQFLETIK